MDNKRPNSRKAAKFAFFAIAFIFLLIIFEFGGNSSNLQITKNSNDKFTTDFRIIVSSENEDLGGVLQEFAKTNEVNLDIEYAGTLDIMERLNSGEQFDAVWASNSIWLYMLENVKTSNSKCTSINPVVFAVKESKAKELGFVDKEIYTKDIVDAIKSGDLTFSMPNPTQTNTGATAYLGLLSTLAGNPEVLTETDLQNEQLKEDLVALFSGLERSSGSEAFLEEMFLNGSYDAVVTYEFSIININKELVAKGEEPLYVLYPIDGVSISDSPLAYIDNKDDSKKAFFTALQEYVLSDEGQALLAEKGRRTWYGGINTNADKTVFNPAWGINTEKYIVPVKYPSTAIIKKALGMYQTEFRRPIHVVFCLDYSGSMYGNGYNELMNAMDYILSSEAENELIQFSSKDKIDVLAFSATVSKLGHTDNGEQTSALLSKIHENDTGGSTALYPAAQEAVELLSTEDSMGTTVILMTDGDGNVGKFSDLKEAYEKVNKDIPIYSIMFGSANEEQLNRIAKLSNGKVFDGKTDLIAAFKEVRGYN